MLLYLTSDENLGLFDFLNDDKGMFVKKLTGQFSLQKFVIFDMRNLNNFNYIAIDLEAINDKKDELVEAIIAIKTLCDSRVILFAENADIELLNKIIEDTRTYNIVTANTIDKIKEEILMCVSPNGMNREYLLKTINSSFDFEEELIPQYSFLEDNVKILVAGSMGRIGTTTVAMNIASYLGSIGAKVSYTEANENNHLEKIHSYFFFNNHIKDNYFSQDGIDYFFNSNIPSINYDFNIIDLGVLKEKNSKIFEIGDVKILCGGIKPYEINKVQNSINILGDNEDLSILLSEGDMINIKKELPGDLQDNIYRSKISSSLFNKEINNEIWNSILRKYIVKHKTL